MVVPTSGKREQVLKLVQEKDRIEEKINQIGEILKRNNVGMSEPLVTVDGFPRNDIDVYQVRHARHEIICLQHDLQELMDVIKKSLEELHKEEGHHPSSKYDPLRTQSNPVAMSNHDTPIVIVNLVSPNSPAEEAGIKVRDQIIEFGTINSENFVNLAQIGELTKHSQNHPMALKIRRDELTLNLTLTPKMWSGRGLLGCNIVALGDLN